MVINSLFNLHLKTTENKQMEQPLTMAEMPALEERLEEVKYHNDFASKYTDVTNKALKEEKNTVEISIVDLQFLTEHMLEVSNEEMNTLFAQIEFVKKADKKI